MTEQSAAPMKPEDYLSSNPEQQHVGDTAGGMDSLASYEDGGDMDQEAGEQTSALKADLGPGTGSAATDGLSNNSHEIGG